MASSGPPTGELNIRHLLYFFIIYAFWSHYEGFLVPRRLRANSRSQRDYRAR